MGTERLSDNHVNGRVCHSGESRNPVFKTPWNASGFRVKPGMTVVGQPPEGDFNLREGLPKKNISYVRLTIKSLAK